MTIKVWELCPEYRLHYRFMRGCANRYQDQVHLAFCRIRWYLEDAWTADHYTRTKMLCAVHLLIWDRRERPAPPVRVEYSLVLAMATLAYALDGLVARNTTGHCRGGRVLLGAPSLGRGYATKLFAQYYSSSDKRKLP